MPLAFPSLVLAVDSEAAALRKDKIGIDEDGSHGPILSPGLGGGFPPTT